MSAVRDGLREALVHSLFFLPTARQRGIDRWLRGREEHRKIHAADALLISWAKSGRTWLRVMLSRFYQVKHGLPESAFLEFDNLKRANPAIPSVFFTHGNYLRDYTGHWDHKRDFDGTRVVMLVRDPRDVAVSQYFQWKHRMRPWKKVLNDYPPHGSDISVRDFVIEHDSGLRSFVDFLNQWAEQLPRCSAHHIVRYEEMRRDPGRVLGDVLAFLGTPGEPAEIEEAVRFASVENMRELEEKRAFGHVGRRMRPGEQGNPDSYKVRRAKVSGYRDYFEAPDIAAIDAYVKANLAPVYGYCDPPPLPGDAAQGQ